MFHMIFEDNEEAPISQLISYVYENSNILVHFSSGNRNIKSKLCENYNKNDKYIIFFDLVPDNYTAINEYRKLMDFIFENQYQNVTIIPIPCIEYYVLKIIEKQAIKEIEVALNFGKYKETKLCKEVLRGKCKSFEIYCKKVLSHKTEICYRNEKAEKYGAWYKVNCMCKNSKLNCVEKSRMEKGCKLVLSLPIFCDRDSEDIHLKLNSIDKKVIQAKCIQKYKEVERLFIEYGYIN